MLLEWRMVVNRVPKSLFQNSRHRHGDFPITASQRFHTTPFLPQIASIPLALLGHKPYCALQPVPTQGLLQTLLLLWVLPQIFSFMGYAINMSKHYSYMFYILLPKSKEIYQTFIYLLWVTEDRTICLYMQGNYLDRLRITWLLGKSLIQWASVLPQNLSGSGMSLLLKHLGSLILPFQRPKDFESIEMDQYNALWISR